MPIRPPRIDSRRPRSPGAGDSGRNGNGPRSRGAPGRQRIPKSAGESAKGEQDGLAGICLPSR